MISIKHIPAVAIVGLLLVPSNTHARFAVRPKLLPVASLSANVEAELKKNPKNAQAHYVLGIKHLACRPQDKMQHSTGLEMIDGRRLPAFDRAPKSIPVRD